MGDMDNNLNDDKELDSSQVTPDNLEPDNPEPDNLEPNNLEPGNLEPDNLEPGNLEPGNLEPGSAEFTGSIIQNEENETEQLTNTDLSFKESFETPPDNPGGKRPRPKLIAAIVIIAVLLAGSVLAYANRNTLANTFAMMTKSPLEYYSSVEKQSINKGIDSLTESYDKSLTLYQEQKTTGAAQDANIKITVNPQFTSMMGLGDFKNIEADISSLSKENKGKSTIGISYNDQSLVTVNAYLNSKSGELFTNIPELSSAYLLFFLDDLMSYSGEAADGYNYGDYMEEIEALMNKESVSPETLNSLLKKYSALIVDNIENMKLDKNINITASDINNTYNMLTSEITGEDAYNISMAVLNEAKNDETVKDLFVILKVCTEDEYPQLIDDAITDLTNNKETMLDPANSILMRVYVNKTGKIMGLEFTTQDEEKTSGGGYYITTKGTEIGFTAWIKDNDVNVLEFTGNGTYTSDGFSGTSVINYSEYNYEYEDYTTYSFNIAIENADTVDTKGYVNGKFTITSDLLMGAELILNCTADEQQQNILFQVLYGNLEAATVDMTFKNGTYQDFEIPFPDQVYDGASDIYSYIGTADIQGFLEHAEEITGVDLSSLVESFLYNTMY